MFIKNGEYRNLTVIAVVALGIVSGVVHNTKVRRLVNICTVFTQATVVNVHNAGQRTYIDLEYSVYGQLVHSTVEYFEDILPEIGQRVGLYYCEGKPALCMLQVYKEHKPCWSKQTCKQINLQLGTLWAITVCLLGLSVVLLVVKGVRSGEFTQSTEGHIVGYEEQFKSHATSTPGTYEYIPLLEYTAGDQTYTARSIQVQAVKTYQEGQQVTVMYDLSNPDVVLIRGDYATDTVAMLLLVLGVFVFILSVKQTIKLPSLYREAEDIKQGIKFL